MDGELHDILNDLIGGSFAFTVEEVEKAVMKWHIEEMKEMNGKLNERCERAVREMDEWWKHRLGELADECTTDFGITDFEMFAEKVFKLLAEKK